jgi:1,2-diacylglycerol 3-alpha-glucosyltransferase
MSEQSKPLKVFIVCSGLGRINRGFESFTRECFTSLSKEDSLEVFLFKGGGSSSKNESTVASFARDGAIAKFLGKITKRDPYLIEQFAFTAMLIPKILIQRPDVVFFSDVGIGNALWHFRRRTNATFSLVFSNGGPSYPAYERWDMVQQVSPEYVDIDQASGAPYSNQAMVPYGFEIPDHFVPATEQECNALRRNLGLPESRDILISVGAISANHKRMDYVLREVALIPQNQRPYLVMLGAQENPAALNIKRLAAELLPDSDFTIRTVPSADVPSYLRASDMFALASLHEGFGRVYVEALANGLPVIAHQYETASFVLGKYGKLCDLTKEGALAAAVLELKEELAQPDRMDQMQERYAYAQSSFSWDQLRPAYVSLLRQANGTQL